MGESPYGPRCQRPLLSRHSTASYAPSQNSPVFRKPRWHRCLRLGWDSDTTVASCPWDQEAGPHPRPSLLTACRLRSSMKWDGTARCLPPGSVQCLPVAPLEGRSTSRVTRDTRRRASQSVYNSGRHSDCFLSPARDSQVGLSLPFAKQRQSPRCRRTQILLSGPDLGSRRHRWKSLLLCPSDMWDRKP